MDTESLVGSFIASNQTEITRFLTELISIPTVNPPGRSYKECADCFSILLQSWGVEHQVISIPHDGHPRYSVLASWGEGGNGLHFHGHYDVVAAYSPEQFHARQQDGRIYGRGSSDMKGGIVAMLFAVRAIQQCGVRLSKRITITLVPDEETGGPLGVRYLASAGLLPQTGLGTLMPEPSGGVIWNACRGALTLRVRVKGRTAHVGLPHQGVNAFEDMVRVMDSLITLERRVMARRTSLNMTPPEAASSVMVLGGQSGSGNNFNSVPESAWFSVDRRINPEENLAQAKEELNEVFEHHRKKGIDIEVETLQEGEPAVSPPDTPLAEILAQTIADVTGTAPRFELCPGILETRFFSKPGTPGYSYGPGLLEISHGPNEYVELNSLLNCTKVYALTAIRLLHERQDL